MPQKIDSHTNMINATFDRAEFILNDFELTSLLSTILSLIMWIKMVKWPNEIKCEGWIIDRHDISIGQRKTSESLTGMKPMTSGSFVDQLAKFVVKVFTFWWSWIYNQSRGKIWALSLTLAKIWLERDWKWCFSLFVFLFFQSAWWRCWLNYRWVYKSFELSSDQVIWLACLWTAKSNIFNFYIL